MKFLKTMTPHKALDIFIILGWVFILCDSAHRIITGPRTNFWLDIFFMVLAVFLLPNFVIRYRKTYMGTEEIKEEKGNENYFHIEFKSNLKKKDIVFAIVLPFLLIGVIILFSL